MNKIKLRKATLLKLILPCAALVIGGCTGGELINPQERYLNPKFRPDIKPLSEAQVAVDEESLKYGPYRVMPDEIVSLLYPNSMSRKKTANLLQSDCLWLGDAGSRGGDWLDMTWEVIYLFGEESLEEKHRRYLRDLPFPAGGCTFSHAETRETGLIAEYEFNEAEVMINGEPVKVVTQWDGVQPYLPPFNDHDPDKTYPHVFSFHTYSMDEKVRPQDPYDRAAPESFSTCSNEPFTQPSTRNQLTHNTTDVGQALFSCPTDYYGDPWGIEMTACGLRCPMKPAQDLQLSWLSTGYAPNPEHDFHSLKMLVVPNSGRTIARPMTRLNNTGDYEWHVGIDAAPDGSGQLRWSENFTPHIQVKRVAFFYLDDQGQPQPLDQLAGERLQVDFGNNSQPLICRDDGRGDFQVGSLSTSGHPCGGFRAVNPAYDIEQLSEVAGQVLEYPAHWHINLPQLAEPRFADTPVYIEFELDVAMTGAALMFDEEGGLFGDVQEGGKLQMTRRLTNVGSQPIRIERLVVDDNLEGGSSWTSEPAAFAMRLPYAAQTLPIRIGWEDGGAKPDEPLSVLKFNGELQTPDLAAAIAPLMEVRENVSGTMVMKPGHLDGQTHYFYGEPVSFDGHVGFYLNAKADFAAIAGEHLVSPNARFALGATVYRDRQLPFILAPGESQEILLDFAPARYGKKTARLDVVGSAIGTGGQIGVKLLLYGNALTQPIAQAFPARVHLPRHSPGSDRAALTQTFLLINNGQTDLERNAFAVRGTHAMYFNAQTAAGASSRIGPGESETFQIEFTPPRCGAPQILGPQSTALELDTNAGVIRVPLTADMDVCVN